jgi:hypothetical protein
VEAVAVAVVVLRGGGRGERIARASTGGGGIVR